jgi:membrane protein DedA with SNARE-associated domain
MEQLILEFVQFLKGLSYLGIMIALTFEFVPAELVLPLAGYWVYQGGMNFWLVVLAGTVGGTFGPLTLYALGRWGGRPFLEKYGKYFFIKEQQLEAADHFFHRHGGIVAFTARFLPGLRTIISIPCGMAKMNVWTFSVYTFVAMFPITFLYVYLGYKLGPRWKDVGHLADQYLLPMLLMILVVIVVYIFIKKRTKTSVYSIKEFAAKKR